MSEYNENIHIAILGPVSAGKSTLLNALFSDTFSDMKRKKTTMLPQIYKTTSEENKIESSDIILKKNKESNEEILKLRESGQYNNSHFKEIIYNVGQIPDFIEIPDEYCTYSILDMPGLNCSGDGNKIYYDYLQNNSKNIDIYVLVFDVNSSLNTTDEENILKEVNKYIQQNEHGYVHILINKCDDIDFESNTKFTFTDDEIEELYDRCIEISNKNLKDIRGKITISPICTSELYVYRGAINNIESLDEKQLDNIIKSEGGKKQFTELNKKGIEFKRKFVKGLINDKKSNLSNDWMKDTGYNMFKKCIDDIMNNYEQIITYHIEQDIDKFLINTINNIDILEITNKLFQINNRFKKLIELTDEKCKITELMSESIKTKLNEIMKRVNTFITSNIEQYNNENIESIDKFISQISDMSNKIKNLFTSNPIEVSQKKLNDKRLSILNNILKNGFDIHIFTELYTLNELVLDNFKQGIIKSINNKNNIGQIITQINIITNNNKEINNILVSQIISSYNFDSFIEFKDILIIVSNTSNNDIELMLQVIYKFFDKMSNDYKYWISLNMSNINNECDEIKYIYCKLSTRQNNNTSIQMNLSEFKLKQNIFDAFYKILKQIIKIEDIKQDEDIKIKVIPKCKSKSKTKSKKVDSDEEFHDAIEKEQDLSSINNENSDVYNDSDDSDTVYKKTLKNAKVRTNRRISSKKE